MQIIDAERKVRIEAALEKSKRPTFLLSLLVILPLTILAMVLITRLGLTKLSVRILFYSVALAGFGLNYAVQIAILRWKCGL